MATKQATSPSTAVDKTKERNLQQNHGLPTPEGTPAPEDGRIVADKERDKHRHEPSLGPIQEAPTTPAPPSKPVSGSSEASGNDGDGGDEEDDPADRHPPSQEQIDAVAEVLAAGAKDHRKILGAVRIGKDDNEEKEIILNAFRKRGSLVHPDYNSSNDAEKAFKRVLKAAKSLNVEADEINEVKFWDGEALDQLHLSDDGRWTSNSDQMEGIEQTPNLSPSSFHQETWKQCTPYLERLMVSPDDNEAIDQLATANARIEDQNKVNGFNERHLTAFTIDVGSFRAIFSSAAPLTARLRANQDDQEARTKFEELNRQLDNFNKDHQYPSEWRMVSPAPSRTQPPTGNNLQPPDINLVQSKGTTVYRKCARKIGYVRDNGTEKQIHGCLPAGSGYQMLIGHPGKQNLVIFELVAASTFGKGFGKTYRAKADSVTVSLATVEDLENQTFEDMAIAGVACVRRDSKNQPAGGWVQEARTIVRVGFGDSPTTFEWYARSTLGKKFGQALVDEEIDGYRQEAGQEAPLAPSKQGKRDRKVSETERFSDSASLASDDSEAETSTETIRDVASLRKELRQLKKQLASSGRRQRRV